MTRYLLGLGALLWFLHPAVAQKVVPPNPTVLLTCGYNTSPPTVSSGGMVTVQCDNAGHLSVGVTVSPPTNVTPTDCSGTIASGGAAQNALAASTSRHGFVITNTDASAGSGEPLWFSVTGAAAPNTPGSYPLSSPTATSFAGLTSFTAPYGWNTAVSVIAATTGHKYSCTAW